tara:strand:- start:739 stop:1425 length:687 start_codon:yes stop_codon:yes gene_type:complete
MQQSTNKILSERKRFYFNRGIEFVIKDSIPDNIDLEKIIGLLRANLPLSAYEGLNNVYFGEFESLEKRKLTAMHHKDNIYIASNELTGEKDLLDDLVHEFAHRFEENNSEEIYEDGSIANEFLGKRNRLYDLLRQEVDEEELNYFDFINTDYEKEFDDLLYKKVGYTKLRNLAPTLFIRPYAATSLREYFATGFEDFYLEGGEKLRGISPILYNKILSLQKNTEFKRS